MLERTHERLENEFTFSDGSTGSFELRFLLVVNGVCVLSMDITGRKRSEAALAAGTILLVEDDEYVRSSTRNVLRREVLQNPGSRS